MNLASLPYQGTTLVKVNVGGTLYTTSLSTLTKHPTAALSKLVQEPEMMKDEEGNVFIDRNGRLFGVILHYLRSDELCVPARFNEFQQLASEARYYGLDDLAEMLVQRKQKYDEEGCCIKASLETKYGNDSLNERTSVLRLYGKPALLSNLKRAGFAEVTTMSGPGSIEGHCDTVHRLNKHLAKTGWEPAPSPGTQTMPSIQTSVRYYSWYRPPSTSALC